jgi:hypothetical protein
MLIYVCRRNLIGNDTDPTDGCTCDIEEDIARLNAALRHGSILLCRDENKPLMKEAVHINILAAD